jgi:hypothetical protein
MTSMTQYIQGRTQGLGKEGALHIKIRSISKIFSNLKNLTVNFKDFICKWRGGAVCAPLHPPRIISQHLRSLHHASRRIPRIKSGDHGSPVKMNPADKILKAAITSRPTKTVFFKTVPNKSVVLLAGLQ